MEEKYAKNQKARFQIFLSFVLCILSSLGKASEGIIRVVPQFTWPETGELSPDRKFAAAIYYHTVGEVVRIVDVSNKCLAWNVPLYAAKDIAFSPDGKYLAACGWGRGLLMELSNGVLKYHEALAGSCIAFSRDSNGMFVTTDSWKKRRDEKWKLKMKLFHISLSGRILDTYELEMSVPEIIEVSHDGSSVRVTGMYGEPAEHIPHMGTAVQTIDLHTKRSTIQKGARMRGYPQGRRRQIQNKLPACDIMKTLGQEFESLWWDEVTGLCVVWGTGNPEGGVIKIWYIKKGRFLSTLGTGNTVSNVGGFLKPDVLIADSQCGKEKVLTIFNLSNSTTTHTGIRGARYIPSPDGRHVAVVTGTGQTGKLELWNMENLNCVSKIDNIPLGKHLRWLSSGKCSMCIARGDKDKPFVEVHYFDKSKVDKFYLPDNKLIWSCDADTKFRMLAIGLGASYRHGNGGSVVLVDLRSKKILSELKSFSTRVVDVRFVNDKIIAGDFYGLVKLWDYNRNEVIWSSKTSPFFSRFGYVAGGKFIVCQSGERDTKVLSIEKGAIKRSISSHLRLIMDGTVALETRPASIQVDLVVTDSGKKLLSFCPLPDDQWIIYTPDGYWDSSKKVHEWVKFYRKSRLLDVKDAAGFRQRDRINAILDKVFNTNRVD